MLTDRIIEVLDSNLDSSDAIAHVNRGGFCCREGWNGKRMFVFRVNTASFFTLKDDEKVSHDLGAFLCLCDAQGNFYPWVCSQLDIVAKDWQIIRNPFGLDNSKPGICVTSSPFFD